jgi:hypothetical protein
MAGFAASAVGRSSASAETSAPGRIVDTHHHFFPPPYLEPLAAWNEKAGLPGQTPIQRAWTVTRAIDDMDRNGVVTAVLSISTPGIWFGEAVAARKMARISNEYGADMMRAHPGRFGLFACVPMPDVEGTLRD